MNHGTIAIYTKYEKKVREFIELNTIENTQIFPTRHALESFIYSQDGNSSYSILADDIFSKIFIENRVRKSSIKHLDLLLALKE